MHIPLRLSPHLSPSRLAWWGVLLAGAIFLFVFMTRAALHKLAVLGPTLPLLWREQPLTVLLLYVGVGMPLVWGATLLAGWRVLSELVQVEPLQEAQAEVQLAPYETHPQSSASLEDMTQATALATVGAAPLSSASAASTSQPMRWREIKPGMRNAAEYGTVPISPLPFSSVADDPAPAPYDPTRSVREAVAPLAPLLTPLQYAPERTQTQEPTREAQAPETVISDTPPTPSRLQRVHRRALPVSDDQPPTAFIVSSRGVARTSSRVAEWVEPANPAVGDASNQRQEEHPHAQQDAQAEGEAQRSPEQERAAAAPSVPVDVASSPAEIEIRLLGGFSLSFQGEAYALQKSPRQRTLVAYVAAHTVLGVLISSEQIMEDVLRPVLAEDVSPEALKHALYATVYQMRNRFRSKKKDGSLASVDPFSCKDSLWTLSSACTVVDLAAVHQAWSAIQQERSRPAARTSLIRERCEELIAAYSGDFLGSECPSDSWAQEIKLRYQSAYLWSLWFVADAERKAAIKTLDEEDRQALYKRAGELFARYAVHAVENEEYSLKALRRSFWCHSQAGMAQGVRTVFDGYKAEMRKLFGPEWEMEDTETIRMYEDALQGTTSEYRITDEPPPAVTP